MAGRLILCATPIGNLEDASPRLATTLANADKVFAEDTRRTAKLLRHLGIDVPLRSYFTGNEEARAAEIRQLVQDGATVALVTDAGMPSIADPGHSAVGATIDAGGEVSVVPGPSAVTAAVAVAGLASDRFVFEGFLPRKGKARKLRIAAVAAEVRTVVLFLAPSRIGKDLRDLADSAGPDRLAVIARELTKLHEEIWRGSLSEAVRHWTEEVEPRGEFTLVLAAAAPTTPERAALAAEVEHLVAGGSSRSDAIRVVAERHGVSRRGLYQEVISSEE